MIEPSIMSLGYPVGCGLFKLCTGHAGAGGDDDLKEAFLSSGGDGFHVAFEDSFERLLCLPFRVLGGELLDAIKGKNHLGVHGRFDPEGAVVVEGRDALVDGNEVW